MSVQIIVQRIENKLAPASAFDLEQLDKVRQGVDLACKLWAPRSLRHQRWYRALLALVCSATDRWPSPDSLHVWLKIKSGLVERVVLEGDEAYTILRSTSFEEMDQTDFKLYTEAALNHIFDSGALDKSERKTIIAEINKMVGGDPR